MRLFLFISLVFLVSCGSPNSQKEESSVKYFDTDGVSEKDELEADDERAQWNQEEIDDLFEDTLEQLKPPCLVKSSARSNEHGRSCKVGSCEFKHGFFASIDQDDGSKKSLYCHDGEATEMMPLLPGFRKRQILLPDPEYIATNPED